MNLFKRILMNAVGGSPGGGAVPPTPNAPPPAPPAQGDPAPPLDRAAIEAAAEKKGRDAAYAELRRNGALKKSYVAQREGANGDPAQANQPAQADPLALRRLDRALNRSGHAARLSDAQYGRLERAFASEAPEDADAWVTDYFGGFGNANQGAAPAAPAPNAAPPAPASATPVTDRGAPASTKTPPEEANLIRMSDDDRKALIATKGLKWYTAKLREQTRGQKVQIRR